MKFLVKSQRIYTERGCLSGAFLVEDGTIRAIYTDENLPDTQGMQIRDYGRQRIIPGIIEMHVHGYKGWHAMSPDKEEIKKLGRALTTCGVTAFLPTNHLTPRLLENTAAIADACEEPRVGARILGIHMEGPFISPKVLGSVDPAEICAPDLERMKKWVEISKGHIVTVTMAPEIPGNLEILDYLVQNGINPCIGHSWATYEECERAIDRGAVITQKTGNCMRMIHQREVGVVGAALLDKRIYNELNSDCAHTSAEFLRICYEMKGPERLCLVADAGKMSGLKTGLYHLPADNECGYEKYEVGTDGLLHIADGTIDGSALHILYGIQNWVERLGIPMEEAVQMASLNPARVCHVSEKKGSIKEHKDADYVVIGDDYRVIETVVEGITEYTPDVGCGYDNPECYEYLVEEY